MSITVAATSRQAGSSPGTKYSPNQTQSEQECLAEAGQAQTSQPTVGALYITSTKNSLGLPMAMWKLWRLAVSSGGTEPRSLTGGAPGGCTAGGTGGGGGGIMTTIIGL